MPFSVLTSYLILYKLIELQGFRVLRDIQPRGFGSMI